MALSLPSISWGVLALAYRAHFGSFTTKQSLFEQQEDKKIWTCFWLERWTCIQAGDLLFQNHFYDWCCNRFWMGWGSIQEWGCIQVDMIYKRITLNPQKRPTGLILSLRVQMRVSLEFGPNLGIFAYCFSSFLRVLFEGGSLLRIYGI